MAEKRIILCVDDEPTVLSVTMHVLRDMFPGEEIRGASSPEEGCRVMKEIRVAVLITDLSMPNMDGADVIRSAHEIDSRTVSIMVTGRASAAGLIRAVNEGQLWRCLEKPWRPEQLCPLVSEALEVYSRRLAGAAGPAAEDPPERSLAGKEAGRGKPIMIRKGSLKSPKVQYRLANRQPRERKLRIMDKRYRDMTMMKEGGSGAIYKAYDTLLDIPVAVKIISDDIASDSAAMKELVAEARIAMGLSHKHIVRLHNIEQGNSFYYLVMEYIKGESLRDLLERMEVFTPQMTVQIMDVMEDALGYAHRHGVFHRDIKPDNIMIDDTGLLKIVDFGLSCLGETFRRSGKIEGTPYYMSPEEMACEVPDQRVDVFSVGIMLHEFLEGYLPPHGGDEDLASPLDYIPVASPMLPEAVQHVLQKSFALDRSDRWPDMHEFAEAFRCAVREGFVIKQDPPAV